MIAVALLLGVPAFAQKEPSGFGPCTGGELNDIGPNFRAQPDNDFVTASGSCGPTFDCQDYFDITCGGDETVLVTFCAGGGAFQGDPA
ncbi:MAG: hypothetical protein ACRD0X_05565, partial [Thermoanaerobaculia bacterium]